jgi:hypothetical protein
LLWTQHLFSQYHFPLHECFAGIPELIHEGSR